MNASEILLPILFFVTALVYAMGGLGGGSTYLALLALFGMPYQQIPILGLICNILVVTMGCFEAQKAGYLSVKRILPFVITSIPFSFFSARLPISETAFFLLLAFALSVAALRLLFHFDRRAEPEIDLKKSYAFGLPVGAVLGVLSGLTGIGGGIFLAPILHLKKWGNSQTIAAATSLFILVNSLAGVAGKLSLNTFSVDWRLLFPLALAVACGGTLGAKFSYQKLAQRQLQQLTALLVMSVALRLFWQIYAKG